MAKKIQISNNEKLKTTTRTKKIVKTKRKIVFPLVIIFLIIILIASSVVIFKPLLENRGHSKLNTTNEKCFDVIDNKIIGYDDSCSKNIIIPNEINGIKIKEIGEQAFYEKNIESVILPDGLKKIRKEAFARNKIKEIVIPDTVTKIYSSAFMSNKINKVSFGKSLELIGSWAFDFNYIENLVIPDSVININYEAFANNNLSKVIIGKNVQTMEYSVFGQYEWNDDVLSIDCDQNRNLKYIVNKTGKPFDWYDILSYDNEYNGPELWIKTGTVKTNYGEILITSE